MQFALFAGGAGIVAVLVLRRAVRWWRTRIDVDPVSEGWLAQRRGMPQDD